MAELNSTTEAEYATTPGSAKTHNPITIADVQALFTLIDKLPLTELPREPKYIEHVARGHAGTVYRCRIEDVPFDVMIKIVDLIRSPELKDHMELEYRCYCNMVPLWGTIVPFCIWAGSMPNFRAGLATTTAGAMRLDEWVVQKEHEVGYDSMANILKEGLAKIHARGVAHGDVSARHIIIDDDGSGKVMFVDFGGAVLLEPDGSNTAVFEAKKQYDLECLASVLDMVKMYTKEKVEPANTCAANRACLRIE